MGVRQGSFFDGVGWEAVKVAALLVVFDWGLGGGVAGEGVLAGEVVGELGEFGEVFGEFFLGEGGRRGELFELLFEAEFDVLADVVGDALVGLGGEVDGIESMAE